ncbi:MAG TPA: hypothetical protein VGM20_04300 [Gemmatimonadales bacterium]|jgi:hypothetical protein
MSQTMSAAQRRKGLNSIQVVAHALKYALMTSAYTPGQTAYAVTHEASGTNYSAGGNAVSGAVNATGTNKSYADIADPVFPALTCADFRYGVLYDTNDSNAVVLEQDLGAQNVTAVDVTVTQPTADETHAMIQL